MENEILHLKEYQSHLISATKRIYERIYKFDITNNCVSDDETREYLQVDGFWVSDNFEEIIQHSSKKIIEESFRDMFLQNLSRSNIIKLFQSGKESFSFEYLRVINGECVWYRDICNIFCINNEVKVMIFIENIDKMKRIERKILLENQMDKCTNIYNKSTASEKISQELKATKVKNALFIIDIDNFKSINDTFGHQIGDKIIKNVADKLKHSFRDIDIVGRIGGDEFIVLAVDTDKNEVINKKYNEIMSRISEIEILEHPKLEINLSIGIAINHEKESFDSLFKRADEALYQVKREGKNNYAVYE